MNFPFGTFWRLIALISSEQPVFILNDCLIMGVNKGVNNFFLLGKLTIWGFFK